MERQPSSLCRSTKNPPWAPTRPPESPLHEIQPILVIAIPQDSHRTYEVFSLPCAQVSGRYRWAATQCAMAALDEAGEQVFLVFVGSVQALEAVRYRPVGPIPSVPQNPLPASQLEPY